MPEREPTIKRMAAAALINAGFAGLYFLGVLYVTALLEHEAIKYFIADLRDSGVLRWISWLLLYLAMGNCGPLMWILLRDSSRPVRVRVERLLLFNAVSLIASVGVFAGLFAMSQGTPPSGTADGVIAMIASFSFMAAQFTIAVGCDSMRERLRLRRRERRQCEACGYALSQPPWPTCPECGWRRGIEMA